MIFEPRVVVKIAFSRPGLRRGLGPMMELTVYDGHQGRSGAPLELTESRAAKARSSRRLKMNVSLSEDERSRSNQVLADRRR